MGSGPEESRSEFSAPRSVTLDLRDEASRGGVQERDEVKLNIEVGMRFIISRDNQEWSTCSLAGNSSGAHPCRSPK